MPHSGRQQQEDGGLREGGGGVPSPHLPARGQDGHPPGHHEGAGGGKEGPRRAGEGDLFVARGRQSHGIVCCKGQAKSCHSF